MNLLAALLVLTNAIAAFNSSGREAGGADAATSARHASEFLPSRDGFAFANAFPYPGSDWLGGDRWYGLCGGMSCAAANAFLAGVALPSDRVVPAFGSALHRALVVRQLESLGVLAIDVTRYAWWMALSQRTLDARTQRELDGIAGRLEAGEFVVLGLVQESWWQRPDLTGNHQVLAFAVAQQDGTRVVRVYDPNFPGNDRVSIEFRPSPDGVAAYRVAPGRSDRRIRGVFATAFRAG